MVIVLTHDERSVLYKFLGLFYSFSLLLSAIIAYLFFRVEFSLNYDLTLSQMQNRASQLSTMAINAHMSGAEFRTDARMFDKGLIFGMYDKNGHKVMGNLYDKVQLGEKVFQKEDDLYLVDTSVSGHLGINYIVIKEQNFFKIKDNLIEEIVTGLLLVWISLIILGYFLGKLFIRPIGIQREKLNRFIKNTTHELNTPVTALLMSAKNPSKDIDKTLNRIAISANRISEIYKDLTYLFLERDTEKVKENLVLKEIIEDELLYFQTIAEKKKLTIKTQLDNTTLTINKEDFIRVFNNLLSNGIKYNKLGGEILVILNKNSLLVKDSGIGIKEESLKEIFTRFYRESSHTGGFGIGLDIVLQICKENSIKISVKSEVGVGSQFILTW